jgi:hypothetical protein
MTPSDQSVTADLRARVRINGMLWAESLTSSVTLRPGQRLSLRLTKTAGTFDPREIVELEFELLPDPDELRRLRDRVAELERAMALPDPNNSQATHNAVEQHDA